MKELIEYVYEYIEDKYKNNLVCENTYITDLRTCKRLEEYPQLHKEPKDITVDDLNYLITSSSLSKSTLRKHYTLLKFGLTYAVDDGAITSNPMFNHRIAKIKSNVKNADVISFTIQEQKLFMKAVQTLSNEYKYKYAWLTSLCCGLRMGEVLALNKKDFNLTNKTLSISKTYSVDVNQQPYIKNNPKTVAGNRTIRLNQTSFPILQQALKYSKPRCKLLFGFTDNDEGRNNIVSVSSSNSAFKRFIKKYKICPTNKKVNQHMLRHTFATRMIESGVPAPVLKKMMGHATIETTLDTYTDVFALYEQQYDTPIEEYYKDNDIFYGYTISPDILAIQDLNDINTQIENSRLSDDYKILLTNEVDKVIACYKK